MKYTFEDKLKAVKYYLETGLILYPDKAKTNCRKNTYANQVRFWIAKYLLEGENGLKHKENNDVYSPERKLMIIEPVMQMEITMSKQAKILGINPGTISSWIKRYKLIGFDGLKCCKRGRPSRNMSNIKNTNTDKESGAINSNSDDYVKQLLDKISQLEARNRDLEHKNILSQAEIDYLKKLHALAEMKRQSGTPIKPKSSKNSVKAKNTKKD